MRRHRPPAKTTHDSGDPYAEVSKCQDYTHDSLGTKDVWSANDRNKYGVFFGSAPRLQIQTDDVIAISGDWTGC